MTGPISADVYDGDVELIFRRIQEWHAHRIKQLEMVVYAPDDAIFKVNGETLPESDLRGFKAGVAVALLAFREFPIDITDLDDHDTDEGE
ncbi:hypothetical protein [Pseudomonas sp. MRSN 12121]|uniref:hypothetical protein n=1 Tax=Pseudomonas sp. MRSN 12121 TaxID=1611770 RepID=UPI0005BEAC75|nr:hypothetical protein [Pseudomonas sp. MRSN 12121]AJO79238.1 hypothetical protein TO66_18910 [Pseudomonas sp. MRSN 12121]